MLERDLAVEAIDEVEHPGHRVDAGLGLGGVGGHTGDRQFDVLAVDLGGDREVAAVALGILGAGLLQAGGQFGGLVGHQGRNRCRWNLVGGQAASHRGDLCALALRGALGEAGHDRAVAFLGDHHRVAAIQRQVVVGCGVAFEVVGDGVARGLFGGVDQQLEVAGQRQLLLLDDLHGVERHHDAVLVILGTAAIHAIADQGDLERIKAGAVLQHPVFRRHRHHIGMGVNAHDFIAAAFQGDLVDAVVDVAKVQVERLGQALDLLGNLEEFGIVVLVDTVHAHGRNGHQLLQGFGGRAAVFHPGIEAEQTMDFVLLPGGKRLVVEEGTDGRAEVVGLGDIALGQASQELPEILDRCITEGLEDDRVLLRGDVGVGSGGERRKAGEHEGGRSQVLE
ncbi:hypothetical protein D9M69_477120 [compost metagenome]